MYEALKKEAPKQQTIQKKDAKSKPNYTGISDTLKAKYENRSGFSFDDVKVHYNSDKPAQFQALAYTQGNQVYMAPRQEKHLEHELGHVVQQKQGVVKQTGRINNVAVNKDKSLERNADNFDKIYAGKFSMPIQSEYYGKGFRQAIQLKETPPGSLPQLPTGLTRHHIIPDSLLSQFWDCIGERARDPLYEALRDFAFETHKQRFEEKNEGVSIVSKEVERLKSRGGYFNEEKCKEILSKETPKFDKHQMAEGQEEDFIKNLFVWMPGNLVIGPNGENRLYEPGNHLDLESMVIANKDRESTFLLYKLIKDYIDPATRNDVNRDQFVILFMEYMTSPNIYISDENQFSTKKNEKVLNEGQFKVSYDTDYEVLILEDTREVFKNLLEQRAKKLKNDGLDEKMDQLCFSYNKRVGIIEKRLATIKKGDILYK